MKFSLQVTCNFLFNEIQYAIVVHIILMKSTNLHIVGNRFISFTFEDHKLFKKQSVECLRISIYKNGI